MPAGDGRSFQEAPAAWPIANSYLKFAISLSDFKVDAATIRPHSLKATGINAISHMNMSGNNINHAEIQIFGDYRPDSSQAMQLAYTRKQFLTHLNVSKKMAQCGASKGSLDAYELRLKENKEKGLKCLSDENIWAQQQSDKPAPPASVPVPVHHIFTEETISACDEALGDWGSIYPEELPVFPISLSIQTALTLVKIKPLSNLFAFIVNATAVSGAPVVHLSWTECEICSKPCDCLHSLTLANCQETGKNWHTSKFMSLEELPLFAIICVRCWEMVDWKGDMVIQYSLEEYLENPPTDLLPLECEGLLAKIEIQLIPF